MLTVSGQLLISVFEIIADFSKLPVHHMICTNPVFFEGAAEAQCCTFTLTVYMILAPDLFDCVASVICRHLTCAWPS